MKTIKNLKIPLLLALAITLQSTVSCRKSVTDYCVEGQVLSTFDNSPVEGAIVTLISKRSNGLSATTESTETTTTDDNGQYRFEFKKVFRNGYQVLASHPKYYTDPVPGASLGVVDGGRNSKVNLTVTPETYVKLFTKRISNAIYLEVDAFSVMDGDTTRNIKYRGIVKGGASNNNGSISYTITNSNYLRTTKVSPSYPIFPFDTTNYTLEW